MKRVSKQLKEGGGSGCEQRTLQGGFLVATHVLACAARSCCWCLCLRYLCCSSCICTPS
jgi:hypothetical protein